MAKVMISLQYENKFMKFPVNPDSIEKTIPSASETANVLGLGEVSIPATPALATMTIKSFFWQDRNATPSYMYINWLDKWQRSKKPANLIITKMNFSMKVTCESFRYWYNAGEEEDPYFELSLKEYRPYGAVVLGMPNNADLLKAMQKLLDATTPPVLIDMPRPPRDLAAKMKSNKVYKTVTGDTIASITKKFKGTTEETVWEKLYLANDVLADYVTNGKELAAGMELTIPEGW